MTAITEQTKNSSKAARGLNSIFNNLAQVLDDASSNGKKITAIFDGLGISMYDMDGQLLSSYELLGNLAGQWDSLDTNTKNYIASTIAGTNQLNNFLALMNNFDHAVEATETALNSTGSAAEENSRYMEGLEAKTQLLKATFEDLSNNVIDSELVKSLLDLANGFLSLLNTPVGTFATQVVLLTGTIWGFVEVVKAMQVIDVAVNQFKALLGVIPAINTAFTGTATTATAAAGGVTALGTAMNFALPIIGLISVALIAIPQIIDAVTVSLEEQQQKVEDLSGSLKNLQSEYDSLASKDTLTEAEERRLAVLEAQIIANEKLLKQEAEKQYQMQFVGKNNPSPFSSEYYTTPGTELGASGLEKIELHIDEYYELQEAIKSVDEEIINLDKDSENYSEQVNDLTKKKESLEEETTNLTSEISSMAGELIELTDNMGYVPQEAQNVIQKFTEWANSLTTTKSEVENTTSAMQDNASILQQSADNLASLQKEIDGVIESFNIVKTAQEEYNETGLISIDTWENLLSLGPKYIQSLIDEKGQIDLNKLSTIDYQEQLKLLIISMAQESVAAYASQRANEIFGDSVETASSIAQDSVNGINSLTGAYDEQTASALALAAANQILATSGVDDVSATYEKLQQLKDDVASYAQAMSNSLSSIDFDLGSYSDSSTSSTVSNIEKENDAIKEQSDAFKELNEILEHNIFLKEQQGTSQTELIGLYKDYQEEIHKQANWFREQDLDENSEYIRELQQQWWDLENTIVSLGSDAFQERLQISKDYIEDRKFYDNWGADNEIAAWKRVLVWMEEEYYKQGLITFQEYIDTRNEILKNIYTAEQEAAEKAQKAAEEAQQQYIEALEDKQSLYEKFFNYMVDRIDEEIEKLEEEYNATEAFWDKKIEAIQQANEELEQQIELEEAMDDLARARQTKVMVYKDGRFQYVNDIDEVSEAQANLEKLEREEALRQEVANLEQLKEQALQAIQDQIDGWEKYKDEWSSVVDHYQDEQDRLLIEQELGIELEGDLWKDRLDNLQDYANQYKEILNSIVLAQQQANNQLNQMQQQQGQQWGSSSIGGGGGSSDIPYNWTGSGGLSNWVGGTQTNDQGWVMDGKVAAIIDGIGGGAVPVWYDPDTGKVMSSGLKPGDVVLTQGGYFQITGGGAGNYTSKPWSPGGSSSSTSSSDDDDDDYSGSSNISSGAGGAAIGGAVGGAVGGPIGGIVGGVIGGIIGSITGKHADGTLSAPGGLSLVGENGPELRVLGQGDGIIPDNITKNLWTWGTMNPVSFMNNLNKNTPSIIIQNFNPNLPNVTDGESFANYMRNNFWRETVQFAKT